ncbi:MAG TPA: hypothetical protein VIE46_10185 [Gemmatimonadales bacterium]
MHARLAADFERFRRGLPRDFPAHVREVYAIDLSARYLGYPLPHPIGKGSGQLSLNAEQLEADRDAGVAFVVLKTVIAQTAGGDRSMAAWAVHETRMTVERRKAGAREGWTVTWKGRGWDRSFEDYRALVRTASDLTRAGAGGMLAVPSVKYHLPRLGEPFSDEEYSHTTAELARVWGPGELPLEKDFSPTLAGDPLADERARVLRWIAEVPGRIRRSARYGARVQLKLMNARFDDDFQVEMLAAARDADGVTVFNRLFDAGREVAYGGWELSDRNLRVLDLAAARGVPRPGLSGTGNICSGRVILDYARRGCESVQLHTCFQLPLGEYPAAVGSRSQRALHALVFHPTDGLVAVMLELEAEGALHRRGGELHFLDIPCASTGSSSTS